MFTIPASKAGHCRRALHYGATATPPSEPVSPAAENLRTLASYAHRAAVDILKHSGWSVFNPHNTRNVAVNSRVRLRVSRPLEVSHPEITVGKTVLAIISATTDARFNLLRSFGPLVSHPDQFDRLTVAAQLARSHLTDVIDLSEPQFLILLNRETGAMEYEPVETEDLEQRWAVLRNRMEEFDEAQQSETAPPAEYERESRHCRYCPWLTECHGTAPTGESLAESITWEQLEQAITDYAHAAAMLAETRQYEKLRESSRAVVKQYILEHNLEPITVRNLNEQWQARVTVSEKPTINQALARRFLSPQQIESITLLHKQETVRITKDET